MKKLFWDNPYQTSLQTKVAAVDGNRLLFEETIAYSFSGGQESDTAYINGLLVSHSEMEGKNIFYMLKEGHGLNVGDPVTMTIDWPRRYKLMRLHFAAELVLELVTKKERIGKTSTCPSSSRGEEGHVLVLLRCFLGFFTKFSRILIA